MFSTIVIAQVLLTLVVGLWLGAKFHDSAIMSFFGRNDWFVGAFLILIGYMNYVVYDVQYVKNLNLIMVIMGLLLVLFSVVDLTRK